MGFHRLNFTFFSGSVIMIEAGWNVRREFRTFPESSIIYPVITDSQYLEYQDGQRDRFEVHELSYHGPNWPAHINYWPNYNINSDAKRVLRIWRKTSLILRDQKVDKVSCKIEKFLHVVRKSKIVVLSVTCCILGHYEEAKETRRKAEER